MPPRSGEDCELFFVGFVIFGSVMLACACIFHLAHPRLPGQSF